MFLSYFYIFLDVNHGSRKAIYNAVKKLSFCKDLQKFALELPQTSAVLHGQRSAATHIISVFVLSPSEFQFLASWLSSLYWNLFSSFFLLSSLSTDQFSPCLLPSKVMFGLVLSVYHLFSLQLCTLWNDSFFSLTCLRNFNAIWNWWNGLPGSGHHCL